jgi:hypothetical protein
MRRVILNFSILGQPKVAQYLHEVFEENGDKGHRFVTIEVV